MMGIQPHQKWVSSPIRADDTEQLFSLTRSIIISHKVSFSTLLVLHVTLLGVGLEVLNGMYVQCLAPSGNSIVRLAPVP